MKNLENLKNDIYKWFDNELSVIIENDKRAEYKKRLQKEIIRIKENDTINRRLHQTGYDFDTLLKNAIEKAIKNNEAATKKVINDCKIMIKNHIDKILINIKYSSFDKIFEYAIQKRTHYINDRYGVYFLKIYEYILDYISESQTILTEPKQIDKRFSVLEWATIFYYADETKLLPDDKVLKKRIEKFIVKHNTNTTFYSFKNKYYDAKMRINKNNNYPIGKLKSIIPFLTEHYNQAIIKVGNDIEFLKNENADY